MYNVQSHINIFFVHKHLCDIPRFYAESPNSRLVKCVMPIDIFGFAIEFNSSCRQRIRDAIALVRVINIYARFPPKASALRTFSDQRVAFLPICSRFFEARRPTRPHNAILPVRPKPRRLFARSGVRGRRGSVGRHGADSYQIIHGQGKQNAARVRF